MSSIMELIYQQGGKNAKSYFLEYYRKNYQGGLPKNIENIINNNKEISLKSQQGIFSLIDKELDLDSQRIMRDLHSKLFARIYGKNVRNRPKKIEQSSKAILDKYIELFNKKSKNNTYMNNNSKPNSNGNSVNNNNVFLNNATSVSNNNNPLGISVPPSNTPSNTPNDPSNMGSNINSNMGSNVASNMDSNMGSNTTNTTTLPNNNSSNFEMTANSLKTFEDEDNMLQKKVRHIGENLEKLSLFSNVIDNAIAKITELNERIALLTSNNGDKQEIAKLSKEKEKLMKLLVNIDGLLNEKTSNMNSKVERLKTIVEQSNPSAANMVGGKHSKKHRRNMKHKKTMKNRRTRKH